MARWEVRTRTDTVEVEGANWLLAVGAALPALGLEPSVLSRLLCDVRPNGVVRILDPISRTPLLVRMLPEERNAQGARMVVPVGVVAGAASPIEVTEELSLDEDTRSTEVDATAPPPPPLHMSPPAPEPAPTPGSAAAPRAAAPERPHEHAPAVPVPPAAEAFHAEDIASLDHDGQSAPTAPPTAPPADLAEQLFVKGMDIADAPDLDQAAQATLSILRSFVPAQASSVLYASINDTDLRFLAADGPSADDVRGITVPLGTGIAGFCFDTGAGLIIRNAGRDPRHLHDVDERTGFHTGDMLSVALRDHEGGIHGCIQLINPPRGFSDWQFDAATTLASTLADFMRARA